MSVNKGIELKNLTIKYRVGEEEHKAVDNVSLTLRPGKIVGLIGESGCGKSTIMNAILDTLPNNGFVSDGKIIYNGTDLLKMNAEQRRQVKWTEIACAFQYAQSSMNPVAKVIDQFLDVFEDHGIHKSKEEKMALVQEKVEMCGLDWKRVVESYPHELSGGMRQRVVIANSLILDPDILLLDEPTTALDIITQAFIVEALRHVHKQLNVTMLLISHDIGNIAKLAEDVIVMYAGNVVESGRVEDIFYRSKHPYTRGLINSTPSLTEDLSKKKSIPGEPPNLLNMPSGCRFNPRCQYATDQCRESKPPLVSVGLGHKSACFYIDKIGGFDHV